MRFSTLWSLDATVDPATGRSPVADGIAASWDHDPGSARFFRSSANFIYRLQRGGKPAYLRIAAASERPRAAIAAEIELLAWLAGAGQEVVRPIPTRDGAAFATHDTAIGRVHAVLFDGLDGVECDLDDLSLVDMGTWGAAAARLHDALAHVPAGSHPREPVWRSSFDRVVNGRDTVPEPVRAECRRLQGVLADLPRTPASYGLLHTDLELDNLRWRGEEIAFLDFDEVGEGWYLYDIAKALSDLLQAGETATSPRIAAFLAGYRQVRPLPDDMLSLLPEFFALSEFRSYMSLARAIDLDEAEAGADWMRDMIHRLRAWMRRNEEGLARSA
jgi:Ser/Thr protein kinase RdoA (MazF antagonist)